MILALLLFAALTLGYRLGRWYAFRAALAIAAEYRDGCTQGDGENAYEIGAHAAATDIVWRINHVRRS